MEFLLLMFSGMDLPTLRTTIFRQCVKFPVTIRTEFSNDNFTFLFIIKHFHNPNTPCNDIGRNYSKHNRIQQKRKPIKTPCINQHNRSSGNKTIPPALRCFLDRKFIQDFFDHGREIRRIANQSDHLK